MKADLKAATPASDAAPVVAKTDSEPRWWWPFESKPKPLAKVDVTNVQMPDPKITQAWLDEYEPRLRAAIKDSNLQLERRDNTLVVIAPVDGSYNPKRPAMLLPVTLGPFTRVAKAVEADPKTAVLVLGHVDATGSAPASQALSKERAQSIASIFSLEWSETGSLDAAWHGRPYAACRQRQQSGACAEPSHGNHVHSAYNDVGTAEQVQLGQDPARS